ncbi:hypothetical protein I3842_10G116300 [Carya illinoinensis]|uniref:Uncharacterized protein n=1 Tax=Carya illinoinensis TaxID=32201 RepID=A0A922DX04_CARIL|nr:hypothetical protein I3842_10G116300 [Carya illinoinensis]
MLTWVTTVGMKCQKLNRRSCVVVSELTLLFNGKKKTIERLLLTNYVDSLILSTMTYTRYTSSMGV